MVDFLTATAGVALSLAFLYIPGLQALFDGLDDNHKRLWMLAMLAAVTLAVYGLACANVFVDLFGNEVVVTCDRSGLIELIRAFGIAIIANQSTHRIAPRK